MTTDSEALTSTIRLLLDEASQQRISLSAKSTADGLANYHDTLITLHDKLLKWHKSHGKERSNSRGVSEYCAVNAL
jgi:hypothetical protein